MTEGVLRVRWPEGVLQARVSPDGWQSSHQGLQQFLEAVAPVQPTTAGAGWIQAFWRAVQQLRAEAVQKPVAAPLPRGAIA